MKRVRVITDINECREIWNRIIPNELISDLWEVRECFQNQYNHKPHFVVCENNNGICGFLPLSWNEEINAYVFFPGETWAGKTWLEQNRLICNDKNTLRFMLNLVRYNYSLRYLRSEEQNGAFNYKVDEISYTFEPPDYDYIFDNYLEEFSNKSLKRLKKELQHFEAMNVKYDYSNDSAFDLMVDLNLKRYGTYSYFSDTRFCNGFKNLFQLLLENNWLRMTTVLLNGQVAAVDMGCIYNGTYTLLAGGTHPDFPGVAKLINVHHMKWACDTKINKVDFLCGDFNWKTLFHLKSTPLYIIEKNIEDKQYKMMETAIINAPLEISSIRRIPYA